MTKRTLVLTLAATALCLYQWVSPLEAQSSCTAQTISCGETKTGSLSSQDCPLGDGTYYDYFVFTGAAGVQVTATMSSADFDSLLLLENPNGDTATSDDNSGGGTNAKVAYTLTSAGTWAIIANSAVAGQAGNYTVTLSCQTPPPPPGPFLTTPELPNFGFKVLIGGTLTGTKESNCPTETLCVSGSIPGRSELFLRIVGPKPNGYLWPNLIKFSTSKIEVWIQQVSTGIIKYYQVPAPDPTSSDLTGLFDRTGFKP